MKKFLSLLTAVLLVMSISLMPVFAEGESPSGDGSSIIITYQGEQDETTLQPIKDALDAAANNECTPEDGYQKVLEFDATRVQNGDVVSGSGSETITVSTDLLNGKEFYVMHFENNKSWVKVNDASYSGGTLTIKVDSLSVFAVFAKTTDTQSGGGTTSPATGDNSVYYAVMAVVCVMLAAVFVKKAVRNN